MKYLNAFITAAAIYIAAAFPILAQSFNTTGSEFAVQQAGKSVPGAMMMCLNSSGQAVPCGSAGALPIPISGTFSATLTPFIPSGIFGSLTATAAASASTALPTNTGTVEFTNNTTAYVSCIFASGTATGVVNGIILPPGSVRDIGVTGFNNVSCIDQTGSTGSNTILMAGGSGNGSGFGGGSSGGGGGGTVAQGSAGTNAGAWWMQIGDTTNGPAAVATAGADAVSNTQSGLASYARNEVYNGTTWDRLRSGTATGSALVNNPTAANLNATVVGTGTFSVQNTAPIVAGTSTIGKVGIDQTTPGTTNLVAAGQNGAWSVTANAGTNLNTSALATSANQTNKTQFTQLTDGTNAAATYTAYGTAPSGNVPGVNAAITNTPNVNISSIAGSAVVGDPCQINTHTFTPINISTATNTKIVAGTATKKTYVCHLYLFASAADNVGIVEGTGTNCGTSTTGVIGGSTAGAGVNLAANQGWVEGSSSNAVAATATAADDFCLITSSTAQLSGVAVTVQQ